MASVDGITAAKAQEIEGELIVSATITVPAGELILTKANGQTLDVGQVADYTSLAAHVSLTAAHGATGANVGTTNTQDLSNKTLVLPTIASFLNAQHNHGTTDQGGALNIGKANNPAPVTSLTSVTLLDGDPAKTIATLTCTPGRWLLLATCEGVTLNVSGTKTRFSYDIKSTSSPNTLIGKPVSASSDTTLLDGGRSVTAWLENTANAIINFSITKNGNGSQIVTSTTGSLVAIRMG